uniref:IRS-type PTB domain-containing protein n=1 Tax=Salarias fasciatus TaxID=181472 RepID=A0A672FN40_SALFA
RPPAGPGPPRGPGSMAADSGCSQSDVVRRGYLGIQERSHRKYFVLRAGSHTGPSRLEWFKSQEKFSALEKSAGRAALFGSNKQGWVTKDFTSKLMEEELFFTRFIFYCSLKPSAPPLKVWPVTVKSRGAGSSKSLAGENRLCLTATSLIMVRVGAGSDPPSVTIPLLSVRRFGHLNGLFFLELGRSAPNGPGEIWMGAPGLFPPVAQHIHEAVRETIRALRVLPDFGRSPSSSKSQNRVPLVSKRCRLKYRDRPGSVGPLHPADPRKQDVHRNPQSPGDLSPARVPQRSLPDGYMEMSHLGDATGPPQSLESTEEHEEEEEDEEVDEERLGYMVMSPVVSHSVSQDDYVSMTSPSRSVF